MNKSMLNEIVKINPVENEFISNIINSKEISSVYLKNGIRLKGRILSHNNTTVFIKDKSGSQLIYKNMISTIAPQFTHHSKN